MKEIIGWTESGDRSDTGQHIDEQLAVGSWPRNIRYSDITTGMQATMLQHTRLTLIAEAWWIILLIKPVGLGKTRPLLLLPLYPLVTPLLSPHIPSGVSSIGDGRLCHLVDSEPLDSILPDSTQYRYTAKLTCYWNWWGPSTEISRYRRWWGYRGRRCLQGKYRPCIADRCTVFLGHCVPWRCRFHWNLVYEKI